MTDEEMAEEYARENKKVYGSDEYADITDCNNIKEAYLAGLKAGRPKWHKVTDWEDNNQFPNDELKTYLVRLYQDHYVICELDITDGYRQFYLSDNLELIDPQDVVEWYEIPEYTEE